MVRRTVIDLTFVGGAEVETVSDLVCICDLICVSVIDHLVW